MKITYGSPCGSTTRCSGPREERHVASTGCQPQGWSLSQARHPISKPDGDAGHPRRPTRTLEWTVTAEGALVRVARGRFAVPTQSSRRQFTKVSRSPIVRTGGYFGAAKCAHKLLRLLIYRSYEQINPQVLSTRAL